MLLPLFSSHKHRLNLTNQPNYPIAAGECTLNQEGTLALVYTDGRYPKLEDGYSLNQICTETITVLEGGIILELDNQLIPLLKGQTQAIPPQHKYSISGKSICQVTISPPWQSSQNSFTP